MVTDYEKSVSRVFLPKGIHYRGNFSSRLINSMHAHLFFQPSLVLAKWDFVQNNHGQKSCIATIAFDQVYFIAKQLATTIIIQVDLWSWNL